MQIRIWCGSGLPRGYRLKVGSSLLGMIDRALLWMLDRDLVWHWPPQGMNKLDHTGLYIVCCIAYQNKKSAYYLCSVRATPWYSCFISSLGWMVFVCCCCVRLLWSLQVASSVVDACLACCIMCAPQKSCSFSPAILSLQFSDRRYMSF